MRVRRMPCYVCNPTCGQCKSVKRVSVNCPDCGLIVFPKLVAEGDGCCPHCGSYLLGRSLEDESTTHCNYTGNECPHPCNHSHWQSDGVLHECPFEKAGSV